MRVLGVAAGIFTLLLIMLGIIPNVLLIPWAILFGWFPAALRLVGNMPFSVGQLVLFAAATVALVFGTHWFLRQFKPWPLKWTVLLSSGIGMTLLTIMSLVGIAHQSGWILLSKEPVFVSRHRWLRDQVDLMNAAHSIADISRSNDANRSEMILCDSRLPKMLDGKSPWEKISLVFLESTNACFAVLWLRDERLHQQIGSACVYSNGRVVFDRNNAILETVRPHASEKH